MSSVTFSTALGGDGSTVTDDDDATTGLGDGGHRLRFVPALSQTVSVANYVVLQATTAQSYAATAAVHAANALAYSTAAQSYAATAAVHATNAQNAANQATAALAVANLPSALINESFLHVDSAGSYEFIANSAVGMEIGAGDVFGPATAVIGHIAVFNNTNGKEISDSLIPMSSVPYFTAAVTNDSFLHVNSAGSYEFVVNTAMCDEIGAVSTAQLGVASGVATLNSAGELHTAQRWDIAAGGLTPITASTITTAVLAITHSACFTTAYDDYWVFVDGLSPDTNDRPQVNLYAGGVSVGGTVYDYSGFYNTSSSGTVGAKIGAGQAQWELIPTTILNTSSCSLTIVFQNVNSILGEKTGKAKFSYQAAGGEACIGGESTLHYKGTAQLTGFSLANNAGNNFDSGTVRVFGVQKS